MKIMIIIIIYLPFVVYVWSSWFMKDHVSGINKDGLRKVILAIQPHINSVTVGRRGAGMEE